MKKSGILNAQLIRCIAELGHKDLFMIGDAGMPIPKRSEEHTSELQSRE